MVLVTTALIAVMLLSATAAPVSAGTAYDMEQQILTLMNNDRVAAGLKPYRKWSKLASVAGDRAARMVSRNVLSHSAAGGSVGAMLDARHIDWYSNGEAIGRTGARWGSEAAARLYSLWWGSSGHRALMMSSNFNYVGVGVAYRSSSKTTYASIIFSESKDHTTPAASNGQITLRGTTITFEWSGYDRTLQSHMAGLRSFDLQYRVDGGSWRTIRDNTTTTSIELVDRIPGRWYGLRVQSADKRGNLSSWTGEAKVYVP